MSEKTTQDRTEYHREWRKKNQDKVAQLRAKELKKERAKSALWRAAARLVLSVDKDKLSVVKSKRIKKKDVR